MYARDGNAEVSEMVRVMFEQLSLVTFKALKSHHDIQKNPDGN